MLYFFCKCLWNVEARNQIPSSWHIQPMFPSHVRFVILPENYFHAQRGWKMEAGYKPKRNRTIFTSEQLERLEKEFDRQQYIVGTQRFYLAADLGLNETQVKVWFQNRRIKWRRQNFESACSMERSSFEGDEEEGSC